MNRYKFEIFANSFLLHVRFSTGEESGLEWCRKYMSRFQRDVANIKMTVRVYEREKKSNSWELRGTPFTYKKTMIKQPRKVGESDDNSQRISSKS